MKSFIDVFFLWFWSCLVCFVLYRFKDFQISVKNGDPYVIHKNGTLEINVAQPQHSGNYTCIATNNLGRKENQVSLEVKGHYDLIASQIEILVQYFKLILLAFRCKSVFSSVFQSLLVSWSSRSTGWCREEWAPCLSVKSNTTVPSLPQRPGWKTTDSCRTMTGTAKNMKQ